MVAEEQVAVVQQVAVVDAAGVVPTVDEVSFHVYQVSVFPSVGREQGIPTVRAGCVVTDQAGGTVRCSHLTCLLGELVFD